MSYMGFCPTCGEHRYGYVPHRCKPLHRVWCPERDETEDTARPVHASSSEEAATIWAQRDDANSADYAIVGERWEPEVFVRSLDGALSRFKVYGQSVPTYSASELPIGSEPALNQGATP